MQVTMNPIPTPPAAEHSISLGDIQIGTIKRVTNSDNYKYHVILNSQCGYNIYQGFGLTEDLALRDAFTRARNIRTKELAELDRLENAIWGDHEIN